MNLRPCRGPAVDQPWDGGNPLAETGLEDCSKKTMGTGDILLTHAELGSKSQKEPARAQMTDRELLLTYVQSGDGDSLGVFMTRYQESLTRFAARFLGDPEAAQDVVQETFLQVARHPRRLLDVASCHNWLLRVVRNLGVSHIRRTVRFRRHNGDQASREMAAVEEEDLRERVQAEIGRLPHRQREVLLLKVQEERTYREIAGITGLSITNVGYILHHAMKDLSRRMNSAHEARP